MVVNLKRHSTVGGAVFQHFCGGAIIAPNIILSAAHCFNAHPFNQPSSWSKLSILAGSDITNAHPKKLHGVQARRVISIEVHPGWNSKTYENDFAILLLQSKLDYSRSPANPIGPICMPKKQYDLELLEKLQASGELNCKLAGWGVTDLSNPSSSNHLMEVELPWISKSRCNAMFDKDKRTKWISITNQNLCFGKEEGGIDACQVNKSKCFVCQVQIVSLTYLIIDH